MRTSLNMRRMLAARETYIFSIDENWGVAPIAKSYVKNGTILGEIDTLTTEHGRAHGFHISRPRLKPVGSEEISHTPNSPCSV